MTYADVFNSYAFLIFWLLSGFCGIMVPDVFMLYDDGDTSKLEFVVMVILGTGCGMMTIVIMSLLWFLSHPKFSVRRYIFNIMKARFQMRQKD